MELTEDEVLQILDLIDKSSFDFVQLQVGDLKLSVSKGGYRGSAALSPASKETSASLGPTPAEQQGSEAKVDPTGAKQADAAVREDVLPIIAPMVGTFYAAPKPGASPFVERGGQVDDDTTVGLIEVMKVFNAVQSRVCGVIVEICVQNGQFVEYGQRLFLVRPETLNDEGRSR